MVIKKLMNCAAGVRASSAVLVLLCLILATSCSGNSTPNRPSANSEVASSARTGSLAVVTNSTFAASQYPVGREWREQLEYVGAVAELGRRSYVEAQRRIVSCMARKGFRYNVVRYVDSDIGLARSLNPLNESVALTYGYHVPPIESPQIDNPSNEEFMLALAGNDGDPVPGCAGEAFRATRPPDDEYFAAADALTSEMESRVAGFYSSPVAVAVLDEWMSCMANAGYGDVRSPEEAADQFSSAQYVSERELLVRKADLECDKRVRLTASRSAWEGEQVEQWLVSAEGRIAALGELRATFEARMKELEDQEV